MKKTFVILFVLVFVLIAMTVPIYVYAHGGGHGGFRGSIWIGPGWWWGGPWYPYPYYSSPPAVIERQAPIYYEDLTPQEDQPYYWYFCQESRTYYPYVKQCPGGWMKVVPSPQTPPK